MNKLIKILNKETAWLILDELRQKNQSPSDLAKKLDMSVANVDKFIEMLVDAEIVNKTKKIKKGPGRPFSEYGLAQGFILIVNFADGQKQVIPNTDKASEDIATLVKKHKGETL